MRLMCFLVCVDLCLSVAISCPLQNSRNQSTGANKSDRRVDTDHQQQQTDCDARVTSQTLCALADRDSPVNQEQPDTVRQVPHCGRDSDYVNNKNLPVAKFTRYRFESNIRMVRDGNGVQSWHQTESEIQHVERNKEEQNDSR